MRWTPREVAKATVWTIFMLLCLAWAAGAVVEVEWVDNRWIELVASLILLAVGSTIYGLEGKR